MGQHRRRGDVEPDDPIEQLAFTHSAEGNIMHSRHPPLTTTTTGHDGSVRLELDKQGVGRRMREGIDDKAFPEQGAKVSIHSDGSFEGLGCVLANTNLNVLTAVFYWFTLKRDEPFYPHCAPRRILLSPLVAIGKHCIACRKALRMRLYRRYGPYTGRMKKIRYRTSMTASVA